MAESNAQKTLTAITILFTIALPHLYIFGFAYEAGYLGHYGIHTELFPRSVAEYLTSSLLFFLSTFWISAKYIITALSIIFFGFILFAALMLLADNKSEVLLKKPIKWYKKIQPYFLCLKARLNKFNFKILAMPAKFAGIVFFIFYALLGLMVYASLVTFIPFLVGQKVASDEIKKTKLCNSEKPVENCVSLTEYGNVVASGKIIASSEKYIALYNDGKTVIYSSKEYDISALKTSSAK